MPKFGLNESSFEPEEETAGEPEASATDDTEEPSEQSEDSTEEETQGQPGDSDPPDELEDDPQVAPPEQDATETEPEEIVEAGEPTITKGNQRNRVAPQDSDEPSEFYGCSMKRQPPCYVEGANSKVDAERIYRRWLGVNAGPNKPHVGAADEPVAGMPVLSEVGGELQVRVHGAK